MKMDSYNLNAWRNEIVSSLFRLEREIQSSKINLNISKNYLIGQFYRILWFII